MNESNFSSAIIIGIIIIVFVTYIYFFHLSLHCFSFMQFLFIKGRKIMGQKLFSCEIDTEIILWKWPFYSKLQKMKMGIWMPETQWFRKQNQIWIARQLRPSCYSFVKIADQHIGEPGARRAKISVHDGRLQEMWDYPLFFPSLICIVSLFMFFFFLISLFLARRQDNLFIWSC